VQALTILLRCGVEYPGPRIQHEGKDGEAERLYRQSLEIMGRSNRAAAFQVDMALNNLAAFYDKHNRFQERKRS